MNEIMMIHSFISILKMNLWTFFFYFHFGSFGCLCDIIAVALVCFHGFFSEANFLEETQLNQKILLFLAVVLLVFLDPLCLAVIKAKNSFPFLCLWRSLVCLVFFPVDVVAVRCLGFGGRPLLFGSRRLRRCG